MTYDINQKRLILNNFSDNIKVDFKYRVFTKKELYLFDPEFLKHDIIEFIKYANSLRTRNLKSLPFSSGQKGTNLLNDVKKFVLSLKNLLMMTKYMNQVD